MVNYIKKQYLLFILGLIIILLTVWNRIFRTRLPKTIDDFTGNFMICLIILNVIILIIIIIISFSHFLEKKNMSKENLLPYFFKYKIVTNIVSFFQKINKIIMEGPKTVYSLFYDSFNISHILEIPFHNLSGFFMNLPVKYAYVLTIIHIIFSVLPRVIPAIIFLAEILFFQCLEYFYSSLFLYIISLSYKILLWILRDLADNNINYTLAHIEILNYNENEFTAKFQKEVPCIEGAVDFIGAKYDRHLLEWFAYIYDTYADIKWLVYRLDLEKKKFKDYENIFISITYLFGWMVILYYILKI